MSKPGQFPILTARDDLDAVMVLADGYFGVGKGIGVRGQARGELCFNVAMTGYQETLMDPSYAGQIIVFTFPHIGNVGCNSADEESRRVFCQGLVVRQRISAPANFRSQVSFEQWLVDSKVVGISGVDTRALTHKIRRAGAQSALIHYGQPGEVISIAALAEQAGSQPTLLGQEWASKVTTSTPYRWPPQGGAGLPAQGSSRARGTYHIVVLDFGVKRHILQCLVNSGLEVTVVPGASKFADIMAHGPDGILLSNGPGDPFATSPKILAVVTKIVEQNIPLFGICLGHQLLALVCGLSTYKLGRGHRGVNHPVQDLRTGRVEITSQNHGFCIAETDLPPFVEVTHRSLFDGSIEGIRRKDKPAFAVQYHPESSPGPHDSRYLFQEFYTMIESAQGKPHA